MNDDELAVGAVVLGVGTRVRTGSYGHDYYPPQSEKHLTSSEFVRDPRVSSGLSHKVDSVYLEALTDGRWQAQVTLNTMPTEWYEDESAERAITEACLEALDA